MEERVDIFSRTPSWYFSYTVLVICPKERHFLSKQKNREKVVLVVVKCIN
jgi:hypothetical protein